MRCAPGLKGVGNRRVDHIWSGDQGWSTILARCAELPPRHCKKHELKIESTQTEGGAIEFTKSRSTHPKTGCVSKTSTGVWPTHFGRTSAVFQPAVLGKGEQRRISLPVQEMHGERCRTTGLSRGRESASVWKISRVLEIDDEGSAFEGPRVPDCREDEVLELGGSASVHLSPRVRG